MSTLRPRTRSSAVRVAVVAGLLAVSAAGQTTVAAFRATATHAGNRIASGTVALADDDSGTAMFSPTDLQRGATGSKCIVVTYNGSLTASVKLYVTASSGALAPYLDLTVEQGSGGTFSGGCGGFTPASTIYTGTLSAFALSATDHASGVGSFAPTGAGQSRTYRITYTLNASAPTSVQNTSASADFRWEARST